MKRRMKVTAISGRVIALVTLLSTLAMPMRAEAYSSATTHYHVGYVKHTILEQFGVTATETYLKVNYGQSNAQSTFGLVINGNSYCYASAFPGWTIKSCTAWPTNAWPWYQRGDIEGVFSHAVAKYTMRSYFQANGDNSLVKKCWLSSGSLPPLWGPKCVQKLIS